MRPLNLLNYSESSRHTAKTKLRRANYRRRSPWFLTAGMNILQEKSRRLIPILSLLSQQIDKGRKNLNYEVVSKWVCIAAIGCIIMLGLPLVLNLAKPKLAHTAVVGPYMATQSATAATVSSQFMYPKLGLSLPLNQAQAINPLDVRDWNAIRNTLSKGVSLITPGSLDSVPAFYVIGHSSDYNVLNPYAFAFAPMGQAKVGDTFTVNFGKQYTYHVVQKKIINPQNVQAFNQLLQVPPHIQRAIVVTCWPVLTTNSRLVLVGERSLP